MESENYKQYLSIEIRQEAWRQGKYGKKTSKGEKMSLAAIARTLDPPVSRTSIYNVVDGKAESRRIKAAIERELGRAYWIRKGDRDYNAAH